MTTDSVPPDRHLLGRWTPWIAVIVLLAVAGGVYAVIRASGRDPRASGRDRKPAKLDPAFVYDVEKYKVIPPDRIGYREVARIETGFERATALAVGRDDEIVVGGDERVLVHAPDGELLRTIPLEETPLALATSPKFGLLVATRDRVGSCDLLGGPLAWLVTIPGEEPRITSIAADGQSVFVADAGSRGVWRFTLDGSPPARIGDRDPDRDIPGFVVPSPYFDLLVAPDGLLRIVDPGRHRVRAFTLDGDLEVSWGVATLKLEGFGGCCNPSHIAMLPDGRFVTSEKGIPRVKVHDAEGRFVTAVVGCDGLDTVYDPCDVAADGKGRILVLDPGKGTVRIFMALGRPADDE